MIRFTLIPVVLLLASGCETGTALDLNSQFVRGGFPKVSELAASKKTTISGLSTAAVGDDTLKTQYENAITSEFSDVITQCQKVLSGYEGRAQTLKWTSFGIAMVGTIAGSVIVPALSTATNINKAAVAAVGGLSGATNSAQNLLNSEGLTAAEALATRNAIQQRFSDALSSYYKAKREGNQNAELIALDEARASCVSYAVQTGNTINSAGS